MKIEKRSTLTFNFKFIAISSSSKFPTPLNVSREHCMLFLLTAVTANMLHSGISFLVSWYVSYLQECVCEDLYFHYRQDKVINCMKLQLQLPQKRLKQVGYEWRSSLMSVVML
jgi:hypothetical protein